MRTPRQIALVWALLLALTWQSFVTQTHQHFDGAAGYAQARAAASPGDGSGRGTPGDTPATCPICREVASAGAVLLPAPIAIAAPLPATFFLSFVRPLGLSLTARSHAWQSRAPPIQLQA